jgi:SIR2-like domain
MFPKHLLQERFRTIPAPDFSDPNEPHTVLAALPLCLYLTTNYDDFMLRALRAKNKDPVREFCRWNKQTPNIPCIFDDPDFEPSIARPIIFHLHGHTEVPESMVLTEHDYTNFLVSISRNEDLIPLRIRKALVNTFPLFLGYCLTDGRFQNLFQVIAPYLELNPYRRTLELKRRQVKTAKIQQYLDKYYPDLTSGYQEGLLKEFTAELRKRWEEYSSGK